MVYISITLYIILIFNIARSLWCSEKVTNYKYNACGYNQYSEGTMFICHLWFNIGCLKFTSKTESGVF